VDEEPLGTTFQKALRTHPARHRQHEWRGGFRSATHDETDWTAIGIEPSRRPFEEVQATRRKLEGIEYVGVSTAQQHAVEVDKKYRS